MNDFKEGILRRISEEGFNLNNFKKFTRKFFNEPQMLDGNKRTEIWREYSQQIEAYYPIAKYTDSQSEKIIILAVELKKSTGVDRARSMQRNFVSKVLGENNLEAAIVAFFNREEESSWRLSFVKLEESCIKGKYELALIPAKRYSYLVGENEPNHTALNQLLPIFKDDKHDPTIREIEQAFSIEKITKEFFELYKEKYLDLKEHLEQDSSFIKESAKLDIETGKFAEQFAKKLMGQLAFLYFLQKKGWLGVRLVPKEISKEDLFGLYSSVTDQEKAILEKAFYNFDDQMYKLSPGIISEENFSHHEIEILSDFFLGREGFDEPWGLGNKKFIREVLWKHSVEFNKNFFQDYLQPLFYEALNKKRRNHYFKEFNCKIPFLNGGLFEPLEGYNWQDVQFNIPNEIFSNAREKGWHADGILDIFDRFNFTMNEAEPLEKEVAVDPEMLGKIFENLLEVSDRKSKGAFYTPREIVHYMCQESLINYLTNEVGVPYEDLKDFILYGELIRDADGRKDVGYGKEFTIKKSVLDKIAEVDEALENVRVADPAVGSGAFPLGMLNEIVKARNNITYYLIKKDKEGAFGRSHGEEYIKKRRSPYLMKWRTIKNCIFAVDIEPSAVDITKLRLWLSIVVDQVIDSTDLEPHPLPNLDINIQVGNSLVDEYEGIKLFDKTLLANVKQQKQGVARGQQMMQTSLVFDFENGLKELLEKQAQYFEADNVDNKKDLKIRIDQLRDELIINKLMENNDQEAIAKYNLIRKNKMKPFFIWELEFAKVFRKKGGFDIVIGNPPYISAVEDVKNNVNRDYLRAKYRQLKGAFDIYTAFLLEGVNISNATGVYSWIIPNKFLVSQYAEDVLKYLKDKGLSYSLSISHLEVFEGVGVYPIIIVANKNKSAYKELEAETVKDLETYNFMESKKLKIF
ncbi:MAG: Eco57I restriction-modification methylase domain-containing protein, partial [Bacillota bacterium]